MKREILKLKKFSSSCCPNHDDFPNETYKNNRSKRARSRDKKKEHQYVRTLKNREVKEIINEEYL